MAISSPSRNTTAAREGLISREALRLQSLLGAVGWSPLECELIAPLTLEINQLKQEQNAVVLAHSYQTPDIIYGIADHVGDSLGLSNEAACTDADTIVFCGVRFMAETAKILSPQKTVLLPSPEAGCSLSESITAQDVRRMREKHPGVSVVCYVNTSAEVKAECDACCTSANNVAVVNAMPGDSVIFLPDKLMAENLRPYVDKEIIAWDGTCEVHEGFGVPEVKAFRAQYPDAVLLAHTECLPDVVGEADMAGSTSGMERYIATHEDKKQFMLVTECGMSDKLKVQFPDREFIGTCILCPHMKRVELRNVLTALKAPTDQQVVEIDAYVAMRARKSIDKMLEIGRSETIKKQ